MTDFVRLPRVCASKSQASDIILGAYGDKILRIDALDTVYHTKTFTDALLQEAVNRGFKGVFVRGPSTEFLSHLRVSSENVDIPIRVEGVSVE